MTLYLLLLIVILTIWVAFEIGLVIRDNSHGKGKTTIDKGTRCFNFIAITVGITAAAILNGFSKFFFPGGRTITVFLIGIAVMLIGMFLRLWSVITLGASFRTTIETHKNQKIVCNGPYKLVRHPSYTGWLLICCGYGIAVQNWLSLLVAVLLPLAALLYRIHVEERHSFPHSGINMLTIKSAQKNSSLGFGNIHHCFFHLRLLTPAPGNSGFAADGTHRVYQKCAILEKAR